MRKLRSSHASFAAPPLPLPSFKADTTLNPPKHLPHAGFLNIFPLPAPLGPSLVISAFTGNPLAADAVDVVYGIGAYLGNVSKAGKAVEQLTTAVTWPNEVTLIDNTTGLGISSGLLVAGGFLVPPKTVGAVTALTLSPTGAVTRTSKLSVDDGNVILGGYFYHRALFHDMDGDGLLDVVAARATKPLFGGQNGQLVWLKHPSGVPDPLAPSALPWAETVLTNGSWSPDVLYSLTSLRDDADEQIFYTSFFTGGGLGMVQCVGCSTAGKGDGSTWAKSALTITVLDATIGPSFDVQVVDLNGDGRLDLLVTNHVDNATDGGNPQSGVFAYEAPLAPAPLTNASAWTKHTLASGFAVREWGPNQAAPGAFQWYFPCGSPQGPSGPKPYALIGGDGDQRAYVLSPSSPSDPSDWTYALTELWDCKGTVGASVVADVNGDGCVEVFVPCYDDGIVNAWSYSSSMGSREMGRD
jgi:hypothetical protein